MKKIFSLAIALIATIGIANAQEKPYVMHVNTTNGDVVEYYVNSVESVTFDQSEWASYATDCSYYFGDYYTSIYWYGTVSGLDLYRSVDDPTQYKLFDYVGDGTQFQFTYDESTGKVNIPDQDTGYYYSSYGANILVQEMTDWVAEWGSLFGLTSSDYDPEAVSYVDDNGVLNFSICYYVIYGNYVSCFGYTSYTYTSGRNSYTCGYEQLTIGDLVSNAPAKKDNGSLMINETHFLDQPLTVKIDDLKKK